MQLEHTQLEHTTEALREAAQQVLELMFFVSAEEAAAPQVCADQVCADDVEENPSILAQVEFRGQWGGRCLVQMPESLARSIAGNFSGILDPAEVHPEIMIETVCEFINMVCGSTITRLGCPGIVTLSPPHLIEKWPRSRPEADAAERWLDTGEGMLHVSFETEAVS